MTRRAAWWLCVLPEGVMLGLGAPWWVLVAFAPVLFVAYDLLTYKHPWWREEGNDGV